MVVSWPRLWSYLRPHLQQFPSSFRHQPVDYTLHSMDSFTSYTCVLLLIIYCGSLILTLPSALHIGSKTKTVSIIHRWSGIMTLFLPVPLAAYQIMYELHPNVFLYLFTVITIAFNCIFGALLIPSHIPKWDIPTIRAHVEYPFNISFLSFPA